MPPNLKAGDIIEFSYIHSLSSGLGNTYQGICIETYKKNELNAAFSVIFRFCGVEVLMKVKTFSPHLTSCKIIAKSSGK